MLAPPSPTKTDRGRVSFARKATYSELTASNTPSIVSRLPPGSLHGVRRDTSIDAGPASKWLRDGLSSAADANEALRVVETIFVSDGVVTDWLGCTPQGILKRRPTPAPKDAWPAVFRALGPKRDLEIRNATRARRASELMRKKKVAIVWCDDGSGALKRYGLTTQELELLCCFEHQRANDNKHLGSWAVDSERAISARRMVVALQRYEPPPTCCKGAGVFTQTYERGRPRPILTSVELRARLKTPTCEDCPESLLPGPVLDEKDEQAARMPWGAPAKEHLENESLFCEEAPPVVGNVASGTASQLRDAGLAVPVGGEFRRRLGDAIDNVVRVLQRHTKRRVTAITCDFLFGADEECYLLCCRGVSLLSVKARHLNPPAPTSPVTGRLLPVEFTEEESSEEEPEPEPEPEKYEVWHPPPGQDSIHNRANSAFEDRQFVEWLCEVNAPPKYVPPKKKSAVMSSKMVGVLSRRLTMSRTSLAAAREAKRLEEERLEAEARELAGPPSEAVVAAREIEDTVAAMEAKLHDRLSRSLKGEKVCRMNHRQMMRRVKQALRAPKVVPASGAPAPAPGGVPEGPVPR